MTDKELKQYKVYLKAAEKRYEEINTLQRKLNASYGTAEHMFGITDIYVERIKKRLADAKKELEEYDSKIKSIDDYINGIKNKEIKMLAEFRAYDGMSWTEIAASIDKPGHRTTYSKKLNNYLKESR